MDDKQDAALWKAFQLGHEHWQQGQNDNPYPPQSSYHAWYEQGWAKGQEILDK